jgi:hypothetical protein
MIGDWTNELRKRCLEVGYGDVLIGQCDVEGVDKNCIGFCRQNPHGIGPMIKGDIAIWVILKEMGISAVSSSCHWVGLDRSKMTEEQKEAVKHLPYWVAERANS